MAVENLFVYPCQAIRLLAVRSSHTFAFAGAEDVEWTKNRVCKEKTLPLLQGHSSRPLLPGHPPLPTLCCRWLVVSVRRSCSMYCYIGTDPCCARSLGLHIVRRCKHHCNNTRVAIMRPAVRLSRRSKLLFQGGLGPLHSGQGSKARNDEITSLWGRGTAIAKFVGGGNAKKGHALAS